MVRYVLRPEVGVEGKLTSARDLGALVMYACQPVAVRVVVYLMRPAWFSNVVPGLSDLPHLQRLSNG